MKDAVAPFRKRLSLGAGRWAAACRAGRPAQRPSGRWWPEAFGGKRGLPHPERL